jgi:hypothetical protein
MTFKEKDGVHYKAHAVLINTLGEKNTEYSTIKETGMYIWHFKVKSEGIPVTGHGGP